MTQSKFFHIYLNIYKKIIATKQARLFSLSKIQCLKTPVQNLQASNNVFCTKHEHLNSSHQISNAVWNDGRQYPN